MCRSIARFHICILLSCYDRAWLLDVPEKIHGHRDLLRQLVEISD